MLNVIQISVVTSFALLILCPTEMSSFCVNNLSCRKIFAQLYNRDNGWFSDEYKSTLNAAVGPGTPTRSCCNPTSSGCKKTGDSYPMQEENLLLTIVCDLDDSSSIGQTIVACLKCDITIEDSGLITVSEETGGKVRSVFACTGSGYPQLEKSVASGTAHDELL